MEEANVSAEEHAQSAARKQWRAVLLPRRVEGQVLVPLPSVALTLAVAFLCGHIGSQGVTLPLGSSSAGALELVRPAAAAAPPPGDEEESAGNLTWPVSRELAVMGRCGTGGWQREYTEMHAAMLRGELKARYLVALGRNGLADSLVGSVSMFYVAVLQRRAFLMDFNSTGGSYDWAFTSPHINWTLGGSRRAELDSESAWHFELHTKNLDEPYAQHIRNRDVRELGKAYTTLAVSASTGYQTHLLGNEHHKAELWRMGLHPGNIFACGLDYLLRLRPEVLTPHAEQLAALLDPQALKIGVQIRVGDGVLVKRRAPREFTTFAAYFDCAQQIEVERRRTPSQRVLYYLISDSVQLRRDAVAAFGDDKIITTVETPIVHTRRPGSEGADLIFASFVAAAAEMWLLALTDYQVVSSHSGFGRIGVYAAAKWQQAYGIDMGKDARQTPKNRSCSRAVYANLAYTPYTGLYSM